MLLLLLHPRGARRCAQGPVLCSPVDRLGESFRFAWRRSSRRRPSRSGSVPRGSSSSAVEACSELDHGPWASTVGSVFRVWSVCSVSLSCPCGWEWGGEGGASSMNHDVFRHTFDCAAGRPACLLDAAYASSCSCDVPRRSQGEATESSAVLGRLSWKMSRRMSPSK